MTFLIILRKHYYTKCLENCLRDWQRIQVDATGASN